MKKPELLFVIATVLALAAGLWLYQTMPFGQPPRPAFPHAPLSITRADGQTVTYDVEIARSEAEQSFGLMYLHRLPPHAGMVFPYDPPREVAFWMKNTLIPLDMLFVRPDHKIGRIVTNAVPQDVTPIPSLDAVSAVVELAGGEAAREHIASGDSVQSPVLAATAQ